MTLTIYWLTGMLLMITAYAAMPQRPSLSGFRGFLATILSCLFWPVVLLTLWYEQQRLTWKAGPVQERIWLKAKERPGDYTLGRVTVIVRFKPRRVLTRSPHLTVLLRPRPSLDAPLLRSPNAWHLNLICCQIVILKPSPSLNS